MRAGLIGCPHRGTAGMTPYTVASFIYYCVKGLNWFRFFPVISLLIKQAMHGYNIQMKSPA